jgi:hypothetical protein
LVIQTFLGWVRLVTHLQHEGSRLVQQELLSVPWQVRLENECVAFSLTMLWYGMVWNEMKARGQLGVLCREALLRL